MSRCAHALAAERALRAAGGQKQRLSVIRIRHQIQEVLQGQMVMRKAHKAHLRRNAQPRETYAERNGPESRHPDAGAWSPWMNSRANRRGCRASRRARASPDDAVGDEDPAIPTVSGPDHNGRLSQARPSPSPSSRWGPRGGPRRRDAGPRGVGKCEQSRSAPLCRHSRWKRSTLAAASRPRRHEAAPPDPASARSAARSSST